MIPWEAPLSESSRFVGRAKELGALRRWTAAGERLVSIVGPAGMGKTRLALRHAIESRVWFAPPGGVHFCDVTLARDSSDLAARVARSIGLLDENLAAEGVGRALAARGAALVVLDNVDPLDDDAIGLVDGWRDAAPDVRVVVTRRARLDRPGERVLDLLPLRVPRSGTDPERTEAVDLFVDRVRTLRGEWEPTPLDLRAIAEIVRELGGLPLAIELAAARMARLDPERLLPSLSNRPLTGGQAMAWSWALFDPWEREALMQLSVFHGGFALEAAEAIVRVDGPNVAGIVRTLVDRSLVRTELTAPGEPERFSMAESIREFAAQELALSGARSAVEARCLDHFLSVASGIAARARVAGVSELRDRENLQAALDEAVAVAKTEPALRAAIALDVLSGGSGLGRSALGALDAALATAGPASDLALVGRALGVRGATRRRLGRMAEAAEDARAALALALEKDDRPQAAAMRRALGEAFAGLGDHAAALAQFEQALEMERALGNAGAEALLLQLLGAVHQTLGHVDSARTRYQESLALAMRIDDALAEVRAAMGLGSYWLEHEDHDAALVCYEHALAIARRIEHDRSERVIAAYLGVLFFDRGDLQSAASHLERAVGAARLAGDVQIEGVFSAVLGAVRSAEDRVEDAEAFFSASSQLLAGNVFFREVSGLHKGHLDLALARRAAAIGAREEALRRRRLVAARVEAARLRVPASGRSLADRSDDARIAIRILERALASAEV